MMINNMLAASRVPWILEQKEIDVNHVISIGITKEFVGVHLSRVEDALKFDDWNYEPFKQRSLYSVGRVIVNFEGIEFQSCVGEDELSLIES